MRKDILDDAILFCPKEMQVLFNENKAKIIEGLSFSDRSKAPVRPGNIESCFNYLMVEVKAGEPTDFTYRQIGLLACFIAEYIYPGKIYTARKFIPDTLKYDGFQEVVNVRQRVSALSAVRMPYIKNSNEKLLLELYICAANEIADFWITIFKENRQNISGIIEKGTVVRTTKGVKSKRSKNPYANFNDPLYIFTRDGKQIQIDPVPWFEKNGYFVCHIGGVEVQFPTHYIVSVGRIKPAPLRPPKPKSRGGCRRV